MKIGRLEIGALKTGETEVCVTEIGLTEIGELIKTGSKIRLHQPRLAPAAASGHHPLQTGAVHQGLIESSPLKPGP